MDWTLEHLIGGWVARGVNGFSGVSWYIHRAAQSGRALSLQAICIISRKYIPWILGREEELTSIVLKPITKDAAGEGDIFSVTVPVRPGSEVQKVCCFGLRINLRGSNNIVHIRLRDF